MPRPLRLHIPGGCYHVTLRGNHRQAIFFQDSDRDRLDGIVAESLERLSVRLHAYCWMTNHVHLLVQVSDAPLGRLMLRIAGKYARATQSNLRTTGHLFERRYHAVLVDADAYLLTLLRYIHLNPVEAGLAASPTDYPWSSHHEYIGRSARPWVTTGLALGTLAADVSVARQKYLELLQLPEQLEWGSGVLQTHPDNDQILGDDAFLARVTGGRPRPGANGSLDELLEECGRRFDVSPQEIASTSRNRRMCAIRAWLCHQAVSRRIATVAALARRLGRSDTAIRKLMERHPHDMA
jgi:REP element-mobilizing transposase RayT